MIVGIHQPHYIPWMGYFDKMAKADVFILLDEVQLEKGSYMYRNRILNVNGKITYLTIPADKHGFLRKKYKDIKSKDDAAFLLKHKNDIHNAYCNSEFFNDVWGSISDLFITQETTVNAYCTRSLIRIKELLEIPTEIVLQSELQFNENEKKNGLVLELCKAVNADCYLSGNGAKKYTDESSFADSGVTLRYQDFYPRKYKQKNASEFIPGLSMLDVFFSLGIKQTKEFFWESYRLWKEFN